MNARTYLTTDDAQADALKDRMKLADLLAQTVDAMPADTDPAEYAAVAYVLVAETLASAARQGLLPMPARFGLLSRCHAALEAIAETEITETESLAAFQVAAKAALRTDCLP